MLIIKLSTVILPFSYILVQRIFVSMGWSTLRGLTKGQWMQRLYFLALVMIVIIFSLQNLVTFNEKNSFLSRKVSQSNL